MQIRNDLNFQAVDLKPLQVVVSDFNTFEEAIRAFRLKVQKERIFSIVKEKSAYEKPSEKKRRKIREASRRKLMESLNLKKNLTNDTNNEEI